MAHAVVVLIMFIGYWTYADYYTKISNDYKRAFWIVTGVLFGFGVEVFFVVCEDAKTNSVLEGFNYWAKFVGTGAMIYTFVLVFIWVVFKFQQSRTYFGKKRNKI